MTAGHTPLAKSPDELREMIRALVWARNMPCDCLSRGPVHSMTCDTGGRLMDAAIDALRWALALPVAPGETDCNLTILSAYRAAGGT